MAKMLGLKQGPEREAVGMVAKVELQVTEAKAAAAGLEAVGWLWAEEEEGI